MTRFIFIIFTFFLLSVVLSGCNTQTRADGKISIVCTIFPQYDWVRQIIGEDNMDKFDLTLLIDSRVDLHSFNPSVSDIARIKTSDVFIYVGGISDNWTEAVLRDANPEMITMSLMELLDVQLLLDGFCDESCDEEHDHNLAEPHADEHIWLSLRHAKTICAAIADMLAEIDPDNAQAYRDNATAYIAKLEALDAEYQTVAQASDVTALVFADRFPFRYMMSDYGLAHYAAFQGCSAETEASFITVISLANRLDQLDLGVVMVTESSDQAIARTVINETRAKNQKILTLDSMQSITAADIRNGMTYLSIMESNLAVLTEALM